MARVPLVVQEHEGHRDDSDQQEAEESEGDRRGLVHNDVGDDLVDGRRPRLPH